MANCGLPYHIGVRPENSLAKDAGIELGPRGHITVDVYPLTSDPDIYAVGDVCETLNLHGTTMLCLSQNARRPLKSPLKTLRSMGWARFPKKRGLRHAGVL